MRALRISLLIFASLNFQISFAYEQAKPIPSESIEAYLRTRAAWLQEDAKLSFSANAVLNEKEQKLDAHIQDIIKKFQKQFLTSNFFCPSRNYLLIKSCVETSPLFHILRAMPKGGELHIHTHSTGNAKWLINKTVADENAYIYLQDDGKILKGTMQMYRKDAVPEGFQSMYELAAKDPQFVSKVIEMIMMTPADTASANPWVKFEACFKRVYNIINYEPYFREYYRHAFELMGEDNIQFVEIRTGLSGLYDLNGTQYTNNQVADIYRSILAKVREKYPNFDIKIIVSDLRYEDAEKELTRLERAYKLRADNPDLIVGYDLVGQEAVGHTTLYYLNNLLDSAAQFQQKYNTTLPYFFHDGESDWANDDNLYDAVLLNTKRIGHGFNLFNFPYLIQQVKKRDICIEVCPISNQVLGYVNDLRLHPAAGYIKAGVPCVICSDDPMMFDTTGLSYDLWEAMMAWNLGVKDLKQFAFNSIKYSNLDEQSKHAMFDRWQQAWDKFVTETLNSIESR